MGAEDDREVQGLRVSLKLLNDIEAMQGRRCSVTVDIWFSTLFPKGQAVRALLGGDFIRPGWMGSTLGLN